VIFSLKRLRGTYPFPVFNLKESQGAPRSRYIEQFTGSESCDDMAQGFLAYFWRKVCEVGTQVLEHCTHVEKKRVEERHKTDDKN
jgi:hypothetical protein